jgi:catechol-2,3-dioxygenase/predicted esterase
MDAMRLPLHHLTRAPKVELPRPPMLVMLHDAGADENQMFDLAAGFDERFFIVCPRGPYDLLEGSYAWLPPIQYGAQARPQPSSAGESCLLLVEFIRDAVEAYEVDPSQVYLAAYGQGGVAGLCVLVSEPELLAGAALTGAEVPGEIHTIPVPFDRLKNFPVLVCHGQFDDVYPLENGQATRDILKALSTDLTYKEYQCGHYLSKETISDMVRFLASRLDLHRVGLVPSSKEPQPPYRLTLGHVTLQVRNLERSIAFYTRFLGMRVTERAGNAYAFLSLEDGGHHVLALENLGPLAVGRPNTSTGLNHIAFKVPDAASFALVYQALTQAGIKIHTLDHTICWSIYFSDPDRNGIEVYWDTRNVPGKAPLWQGRDRPLSEPAILACLPSEPGSKGSV